MPSTSVQTVTYSTSVGEGLSLGVFRPEPSRQNAGAVLVFHGGAWVSGGPEDVYERAAALANEGFVAFAVQYRLLTTASWPAPLDDARAALAWVREHAADYGVDPAKISVQGHSAGAQLSLLLGAEATGRPAAILAYYPPIGFHCAERPEGGLLALGPDDLAAQFDDIGRLPSWMLFPTGATEDDLRQASPLDRLDAQFPPTAIFQGTADVPTPPRATALLHTMLVELGVPTDYHVYAGRGHEFDNAPMALRATVAAAASFLDRMVLNRESDAEELVRFAFPPAR
jgi:acetyl esterase/lipase